MLGLNTRVKDKTSMRTGTIVAQCQYLYEHNNYLVQWDYVLDAKNAVETDWVIEPKLELCTPS